MAERDETVQGMESYCLIGNSQGMSYEIELRGLRLTF